MTHDEIAQLDAAGLRLEVARAKGWTFWDSLDHLGPWTRHGDPMAAYYAGGIPLNKCETPDANKITWDDENDPNWPADIRAAWELVEEAQAKPYECYFEISHTPSIPHKGKPCWHVELGGVRGYGETAPIAICRAYLMWKQG